MARYGKSAVQRRGSRCRTTSRACARCDSCSPRARLPRWTSGGSTRRRSRTCSTRSRGAAGSRPSWPMRAGRFLRAESRDPSASTRAPRRSLEAMAPHGPATRRRTRTSASTRRARQGMSQWLSDARPQRITRLHRIIEHAYRKRCLLCSCLFAVAFIWRIAQLGFSVVDEHGGP